MCFGKVDGCHGDEQAYFPGFDDFFASRGKGVIPLYGIPRRGQRYLLLPARIYIKKGIGTKGILLDQFLKIAFFPEKHTFYRIIPRFIETNELIWNRN